MAHMRTAGRAWSSKKIGAVLGTAAVGLMLVLPLAIDGVQGSTQNAPGSRLYSAITLPPTMSEGATETTTVDPSVPAIAKAAPTVKAPHK
jgi:hypothetical protein